VAITTWRRILIGTLAVGACAASTSADDAPPTRKNLAAGAAYECVTPPNYWGWKNPRHDDHGQLTDGRTVDDWTLDGKPIYSLPSSAGWSADAVAIVIDLGESCTIGGVGLHSVLSPWGPWWPESLAVLVSDDNECFELARFESRTPVEQIDPPVERAEIQAAIDRTMPAQGFRPTTRWYRSAPFARSGRYVALLMDPSPDTGTIVLDEIEIYAGELEPAVPYLAATKFTEGNGGWKSFQLWRTMHRAISRDIEALEQLVSSSTISADKRDRILDQLEQLPHRRLALPLPAADEFRAVLPIDDSHRELFALHAAYWRATGAPPLRVWHTHRWDPLEPLTQPHGESSELRIAIAGNSVRSEVINISNAGERERTIRIRCDWLLGSPAYPPVPSWELFHVPLVDTHALQPVAAALVPLARDDGDGLVTVLPGMTAQVWLRISSGDTPTGLYAGQLQLSSVNGPEWMEKIPIAVDVADVRLPDTLSLHLGGWDYALPGHYQVTDANLDAYVKLLREYGINTVWSPDALPVGEHDESGELIAPPSRNSTDAWLAQFPDAKMYCLVRAFSLNPDDQAMRRKIASWAGDWSAYLQKQGVEPERLAILIRDEPTTIAELNTVLHVGRAIRTGEPRFKIFNDIHWADPTTGPAELRDVFRDACDIQCFNVHHYISEPEQNDAWRAEVARPDLQWWSYTGGASHRLTDPYVAFLLRSWFSFQHELTGVHWWAFGDGHGGFSWNEYLNSGVTRSPMYLAPDGVTTSKGMEALREGAQDFELLTMLRERVAAVRERGVPDDRLATASTILQDGVPQVLAVHDMDHWQWSVPKDRSSADQLREEVFRELMHLEK